jgi:hypothetical protein
LADALSKKTIPFFSSGGAVEGNRAEKFNSGAAKKNRFGLKLSLSQ